jgi:hypothetical protein
MMSTALMVVAFFAPTADWSFTLEERDGSTILNADGVVVIFQGVQRSGRSSGTIRVTGTEESSGQVGAGKRAFTDSYANGVCTLTFAGLTLKLTDAGTKLVVGKQTFDLRGEKKTIVVKPGGDAEVQKRK